MLCGIFSFFTHFFLWYQNYTIKASDLLKIVFKKEIITTITKRERKESQKHNINKMHI